MAFGIDNFDEGTSGRTTFNQSSATAERSLKGKPLSNIPSDLPADAMERIKDMRGEAGAPPLFTSDLSVNEFALLEDAGFEPLGLVMGSSIYHVGIQFKLPGQNQELNVLSAAMYNARELAMSRMKEETRALGADGVVGVDLNIVRYAFGESILEFQSVGTAVRKKNGSGTQAGDIFTSDLSGQDFWTLLKSGYRPVGLVLGSCVFHVAYQGMFQALRRTSQNVELENYTQAFYYARELAMGRMQHEARSLRARGVVGVNYSESSHLWDNHIIEFFASGTAVVPLEDSTKTVSPTPMLDLA